MRCSNRPAGPGRARCGFTLPETLVSAALASLIFVSLLAAFGHESVLAQRGEDMTQATFLADAVRDIAIQMSFAQVLGLEGESISPAITGEGVGHTVADWEQRVSVTPVSAEDLNLVMAPDEATAARVTVTVFAHDSPVMAQTYYVFDTSGVPYAGEN